MKDDPEAVRKAVEFGNIFETMAKELTNLPLKDINAKEAGTEGSIGSNGLKEVSNKLNKYNKDLKEITQKM